MNEKIRAVTDRDLESNLDELDKELSQSKQSYKVLLSSIQELRRKYDSTPSIWPIRGQINAGFGWRRHPIFGRPEFHQGVDIPSFHGASVRATAKGFVSFSGWYSGYGKAVIIDHGNGFSTIYGHNSRLLVNTGQKVDKGQIIAAVGSTGLSTGPHCHYEIRRWNQVVNPAKYLSLDIFSANKNVW